VISRKFKLELYNRREEAGLSQKKGGGEILTNEDRPQEKKDMSGEGPAPSAIKFDLFKN
jgi:hypothetical protein